MEWWPIEKSKNKKIRVRKRQGIETYRNAESQKEIKMEPNLSIRKKKKKKSTFQGRSHLLVTPKLQTLHLKTSCPLFSRGVTQPVIDGQLLSALQMHRVLFSHGNEEGDLFFNTELTCS